MFKLGDKVRANTPAILKDFSNENQLPSGVIGIIYNVTSNHDLSYNVMWGENNESNSYNERHLIPVNFENYYEQIELHRESIYSNKV